MWRVRAWEGDSVRKSLLAATALAGSVLFLVPGAQAFDWDGHYVGGVAGVIFSTGSIDFSEDYWGDDFTFDFDGLGVMAGVTAGTNFKIDDKFVVGIEGDASLVWLNNESPFGEGDYYEGGFEEELQALLTLRGRFGVLTDDQDTLFYVTGGLAGGLAKASANVQNPFGDPAEPATMSGFVIGVIGGVGAEHAIRDDLTVKAEILGYVLGSLDGNGYTGKGDSTATYNPSGIILRTGINFHF
jgi:outer membrane immunogenic protein